MGHEELQSNFNQLLLLCTCQNPELRNWLDRKTSWTSHDVQNEILQLMSQSVLREVLETIRKRDFFAILADETADISRKELLSFSIRTVDDNLHAEEVALGLYSIDKCNADYITKVILNILERFAIPLHSLHGQCYDGAAVMSGKLNGVACRINSMEELSTRIVKCTH